MCQMNYIFLAHLSRRGLNFYFENNREKSFKIFFYKIIKPKIKLKLVWKHLKEVLIQVCSNLNPLEYGGAACGVEFLHL